MRRLLATHSRRSVAVATAAAGISILLTAGPAARATTGDSAGLPPPEVRMLDKYGHPLVGRMDVGSVARQAGVIAGVLDIAPQTQEEAGEYEWFYGELELRIYAEGRPTTINSAVWNFQYANGHVTAELIPVSSVSLEHPDGIPIGSITFVMPHRFVAREIRTAREEPKRFTGDFTLNGRGPYEITFKRTSDDSARPQVLPRAKQISSGHRGSKAKGSKGKP